MDSNFGSLLGGRSSDTAAFSHPGERQFLRPGRSGSSPTTSWCQRRVQELGDRSQDPGKRGQHTTSKRFRVGLRHGFGPKPESWSEEQEETEGQKISKLKRGRNLGGVFRRGGPGASSKCLARHWYWQRQTSKAIRLQERKEVKVRADRAEEEEKGKPRGRRTRSCVESSRKERRHTSRPLSTAIGPDAEERQGAKQSAEFKEIFECALRRQLRFIRGEQQFREEKDQRPWKGHIQLPPIQEEDGAESFEVRQEICEGSGSRSWSRRETLQADRPQPSDQFWSSTQSPKMSLLGCRDPGTPPSGGHRASSSTSSLDTASNAPSSSGHRLDSGMAPYSCPRSFQPKGIRGRPRVITTCDILPSQPSRTDEDHREPAQAGRQSRRCRRSRQRRKERKEGQQGQGEGERPFDRRVLDCSVTPDPHLKARTFNSASGAKPPVFAALQDQLQKSWGSFGRFLRVIKSSPITERSGPRTPSSKRDSLFPSLLVIPTSNGRPCSSRRKQRGRGRDMAWGYVELLWNWFTFLEGGSPYKQSDQEALVAQAQTVIWTPLHAEYAGYLHDEISRYIRLRCQDPLSRGIHKLSELVKVVKNSSYTGSKLSEKMSSVAKDVKPSRMSLPDEAGIVDPKRFLKGKHLEQFENMLEEIPTNQEPIRPTQGCFKVQEADKQAVFMKLLTTGVAVLIPEELGVKDSRGNIITGGLFAVDHKEQSDRIILDRRPFNELERRLVWAKLPHGSLLTQIVIPPGYSIRGSGDDLSNYFYLLKHNEAWLPRNAIGESFDGAGFEEFGGVAGRRYLLCFRVVAMGDLNAVDISQQVHLELLRKGDCMRPNECIEFRSPLPTSLTYEGLYIDDHIVTQLVPSRRYRKRRQQFRDDEIVRDSRAIYAQENVPTSSKKAFTRCYTYTAWGTEVCSRTGRVGTPGDKLRHISDILVRICELPKVSKKMLQKAVGLLIHPFLHNRSLMCLLQETYIWLEKLEENQSKPLPAVVKEELLTSALCLPLAQTDIRRPVCRRIGASDASLAAGGRAATITTSTISHALYRYAEHRGEHVRLDWESGGVAPTSCMQQAPLELEAILADHLWTTTESCTFAHKQHINILEARMIYRELVDAIHSTTQPYRCLLVVDSRAAAGAWTKGRSSSKQLNRIIRRSLGWSLVGRKSLHLIWVRSGANPSDYPSRFRPIPSPPSIPDPLTQELLGESIGYIRKSRTKKELWKEVSSDQRDAKAEKSHAPRERLSSQVQAYPCSTDRFSDKSPPREKWGNENPAGHPALAHWKFREIFAGYARLTHEFCDNSKFKVGEPFELMRKGKPDPQQDILNDWVFERLCEEASHPKQIWHFAFPCGSFSLLQNLNKGTRTKNNPLGKGNLNREIQGNEILHRTLYLCHLLAEHGSFFTLENPLTSFAWKIPGMQKLIHDHSCTTVILDQCMYHLRVPDNSGKLRLAKKSTIFLGSLPGLEKLARRCSGCHRHIQVIGGVKYNGKWTRRSQIAGAYPKPLCKAYRHICQDLFK